MFPETSVPVTKIVNWPIPTYQWHDHAMSVAKWSLSVDEELAEQVRAAADEAGESLSGWEAEAAERRLRLDAMAAALADYEAEHGVIDDERVAAARERLRLTHSQVADAT